MNKITNVFSNRNFLLVFMGALISELGAVLYSFAVSFYILEISSNNAFLQGLYLALCGISMLVFTSVGGVLGDRFNKVKIMYVCDYLKGGIIILATVLMMMFPESKAQIVILFLLGILGNAISGIFTPASGALFPHIIEEDRLQQANAYFAMKTALVSIMGIILAGILYAALPVYILFFLVGIAYVISGISEMFIFYEYCPSGQHLTLKAAFKDLGQGVYYLKTNSAISVLLGAVLFMNFFLTPITGNFIPYFVKTDLAGASTYLFDAALTPELWSSVFSVSFGISSLLGAASMSAKAQEEKYGHKIAFRLLMIACILMILAVSYWFLVDRKASMNCFLGLLCFAGFMIGFLISTINIPISTILMRIVDKDKLSKVNSIVSMGSQGMIPIASMLAGLILSNLGSTVLLLFCFLGFIIIAILLLMNKDIKEI